MRAKDMQSLIETAARAIFAEEQCDRKQKLDIEGNWYRRLDERDRAEYRRLAGAAIEPVIQQLERGTK